MPKLKAVIAKEEFDGLTDENLKGLYVQKEDKYVLDAEGVEDVTGLKRALDTERKMHKDAEKALKDIAEKYKDIDPERAREAVEKLSAIEDQTLLDKGKVDELLNKKTERMKADYENKLAARERRAKELEASAQQLESKLSELLIDGALRDAATKAGVKPTAMPDVILRGRTIWRLVNGVPTPTREGDQVIYGKDGSKPMTPEEWLGSLSSDAPHLFEPSTGGDAKNQMAAGGKVVRLTREQAKNPATYRAARTQAEKVGGEVQIID